MGTHPFTTTDLDKIHDASMKILDQQGIIIDSDTVLKIFTEKGFRTQGAKVFIKEHQVLQAIETAPEKFKIRARNPEKNLELGNGVPVLCGTGGGIFIVQKDKSQRLGTLEDYQKIAKLVQTSALKQMTAHESVHPHDLVTETCHLDMMFNDLTLCDLAATSNTQDVTCLKDCLEMLSIVFEGRKELVKEPSTIGIISPLSPLQYSPGQAEALVILARYRQPAAISNMLILGSSAPVSIPAALALGNAELLAGVVLSQIVTPGAPVIYGSTSCPLYMKNGATCLGAPETLILSRGVAQLAKYYKLPCRTGGGLSDSHIPDGQAMVESSLALNNAMEIEVDYILHTFGMLSSYMATSLEKWIMDEEVCRFLFAAKQKIQVTAENLELESILAMGAKGEYLSHPSTFKNFRTLFQHNLGNRDSHSTWIRKGGHGMMEQANELLEKRLNTFQKPAIDAGMEQELKEWVGRRKQQISERK